jgi:hypothetical protein
MREKEHIPEATLLGRLSAMFWSDPAQIMSVVVLLIGFAFYEPVAALSTFVGIVLMLFGLQMYRKTIQSDKDSTTARTSRSSQPLKNIWERGQSNGSNTGKKNHGDKPFGSKYYYAHNNANATGGYKDGLKTEDYTMNGPRLLSRGGQEVEAEPIPQGEQIQKSIIPPSSKIVVTQDLGKKITKYLWDDPGEFKTETTSFESKKIV